MRHPVAEFPLLYCIGPGTQKYPYTKTRDGGRAFEIMASLALMEEETAAAPQQETTGSPTGLPGLARAAGGGSRPSGASTTAGGAATCLAEDALRITALLIAT